MQRDWIGSGEVGKGGIKDDFRVSDLKKRMDGKNVC